MPAVQLARLKSEINRLMQKASQPDSFRRALADLFDFYADRVYRPGLTVQPPGRTPSYHIPPLVIQQLKLDFKNYGRADPAAALELFKALWQDAYLEPRQLAAFLLGQVPPVPPELIFIHLEACLSTTEDLVLIQSLLEEGTARLCLEQPAAWLNRIQSWLDGPSLELQRAGLWALLPLVNLPEFNNFPPIFRMLNPLLQTAPPPLQPLLQDVLAAMIDRSPQEVLFFVKQVLGAAWNPATARLVRRLLPSFSPEQQASLRLALATKSGAAHP